MTRRTGPPEAEAVVPFPAERAKVPMATQVRSTLLMSSIRSLRELELLDRYAALLPTQWHASVLHAAAAEWLPVDAALAHYEACDKLGLSPSEIVAMGSRVGQHAQGSFINVFVRMATTAGATPWTLLTQSRRMWERAWIGSGIAIFKLGPKEARLEVVSWPLARIPYMRIGMRGIIHSVVELFCSKAYTRELPRLCTPTTVGYKIAWA